MVDSIPPQEWVNLFNRVAQRINFGGSIEDEKEYRSRWRTYERWLRSERNRVRDKEYVRPKWQDRRLKLIDRDLKNLRNLHSSKIGISPVDGIWLKAQQDPTSFEADVLRLGYKGAVRARLAAAIKRLGPLRKIPTEGGRRESRALRMELKSVDELPDTHWKWRRAIALERKTIKEAEEKRIKDAEEKAETAELRRKLKRKLRKRKKQR